MPKPMNEKIPVVIVGIMILSNTFAGVTCVFKSTRTDYMSVVVNLFPVECALFEPQSDDRFLKNTDGKSGVVDVFPRRSREP